MIAAGSICFFEKISFEVILQNIYSCKNEHHYERFIIFVCDLPYFFIKFGKDEDAVIM
jgi:hypothetical protein